MDPAWWRGDGWPTPEEWSALAAMLALILGAGAATIALLQIRQGSKQLSISARADERAAEAAESEARPYVTVRFDLQMLPAGDPTSANGEGLLFVVIESVGRTPARDISLKATPEFATSGRGRPRDGSDPALDALKEIFSGKPAIGMLSTGQQLRYLLDFTSEAMGSGSLPQRYEVVAEYRDARQIHAYSEAHVLDMKPWAMTIAQPKPIDVIARQLRRMNEKNEAN